MPGQCDVDFSVFERRCEIVATHEACRCAGRVLERFDNLGDPRGRQHPGEPNLEAALVAGLGHGQIEVAQEGLGAPQECPSGVGETHRSGGAFEQSDLEALLQLLDRAGQGGLSDHQQPTRRSERQVLRDGDEGA